MAHGRAGELRGRHNGVDIKSFVNVSLSTTTGYSTTASLSYTFSGSGKLCGTNDYPANTARQIASTK